MPKDFEDCVENKGRIKTINPKPGYYQHICYDNKGIHSGEIMKKESNERNSNQNKKVS